MPYFDHAAATPIEAAALEAMAEAARTAWGNPASVHAVGRRCRAALEHARNQVAETLGCSPSELVWTCGGTDALVRALSYALADRPGAMVSSRIEHPAVRELFERAEASGREARWIEAPAGDLDLAALVTASRGASVIAVSALNHELGTVPDLARAMAEAEPDVWWVIDAVQAAAWLDVRPLFGPRTFVAVSGPKMGGPPGVGVLRVPPPRQAQELERAGTPPWLAAIGLGAACEARRPRRAEAERRAVTLGRRLLEGLRQARPDLLHNAGTTWQGAIVNVSCPGIEARALEHALDLVDVHVARTSACRQRIDARSAVVAAAYPDDEERVRGAIRWSLGWSTTADDVDAAIGHFSALARRP